MKVELHILQNFPPSNLNRDDTGAPKDCEFGGYRRARISSQCLKRSIRRSEEFSAAIGHSIGIRTLRTVEEIARILSSEYGRDAKDALTIARAAMDKLVGGYKKDDDSESNVLFYIGSDELSDLGRRIDSAWDLLKPLIVPDDGNGTKEGKKRVKGAKEPSPDAALQEATAPIIAEYRKARAGSVGPTDIALFGRMLASAPDLNIDAACQVAHAISTNKLFSDFDYWTAVDDLKNEDNSKDRGAANIGTLGFNSSCFYRYAVVDVDKLAENLGGDRNLAIEGVRAFIRGSIAAIPTGKQHSTAPQCPPEFIFAVVREKGAPWSLVNAFEKPAKPDQDKSLFENSVQALDRHWGLLADMYGSTGTHRIVKARKDIGGMANLADAQTENVDSLVDDVITILTEQWNSTNAKVGA